MTPEHNPDRDGPRVAVVGAGYWGRNLVRVMSGLGALAAVADADVSVAAAQGDDVAVPARSVEGVLSSPEIDAVVLATPAATHAELAMAAMRSGKDVFVEKPLALSVADGEAVQREVEASGRILMVGHLLRYHPAFEAMQQLVAGGHLGPLRYLYSNRLNFGRLRREENILWSFAPHDISMILALAGSEPMHVDAVASSWLQAEIADVTTTHLQFADGLAAHVFVSWLHPFKEQKLVVVGEDAMAVFDDGLDWGTKLRVWPHRVRWTEGVPDADRAEPEDVPLDEAEPLVLECSHFLDCVRTRTRPTTDVGEGLRVLRVLEAAQRAIVSTS